MDEFSISPIQNLSHFIDSYPIEKLKGQFRLLQSDFPLHRSVRGDGNCFYRAFAFWYLTKVKLNFKDQAIFPKVQNVCKKKTGWFSAQSKNFDATFQQLEKLLNNLTSEEKQKKIEKLFNQSDQFDETIISYFRSVNYNFIKQNKNNYIPYLDGQKRLDDELERISTLNAQSEGIQLPALAEVFNAKLFIFFINDQTFQPVVFNDSNGKYSFYLFFRPGHYDIVLSSTQYSKVSFKKTPIPKPTPIKALKNWFHPPQKTKNSIPNSVPSVPSYQSLHSYQSSEPKQQWINKTQDFSYKSSQNDNFYQSPFRYPSQTKQDDDLVYVSTKKNNDNIFKYNNKSAIKNSKNHQNKEEKDIELKKSMNALSKSKKSQSKIISNSFSVNQFNRLFIELVGVGLVAASAYFVYTIS